MGFQNGIPEICHHGARRDIDLKTLRLFVAACDHQNMARAAEHENIEPSAISKRMAQLETDLGTSLLLRSRRGVQPTPAGVSLLEHARNVLFSMERLATDVAAFGSGAPQANSSDGVVTMPVDGGAKG